MVSLLQAEYSMTRETYPQARKRLFQELRALDFQVKDTLKVPQVILYTNKNRKDILFFHTQAVYLNSHSLFIDIRGMKADTLLAHALGNPLETR